MTGTNTFDNTDLAAAIPKKWGPMMLEQRFPEFVLQDHMTDLSEMIQEGDIVHVPNIYTNTFTASTQATPGTEVTLQSPAEVDVTITVNTQKYIAFILDDKTMTQVAKSYNLSEKYARMAQKTLLRELEDALFALYTSLTATAVGNPAAAIADLDFRSAIAYMEVAEFRDETAVFMDIKVYFNQFIGLSKISPNYSANLNVIRTGLLGDGKAHSQTKGVAYGIPVFTSSRVPAPAAVAKNVMLHPTAYGFAVKRLAQMADGSAALTEGKVRTQMQYKLENLGTLTVCDIVYGVGILRADAGILINALNTATVA
jgi:hypothetical protein